MKMKATPYKLNNTIKTHTATSVQQPQEVTKKKEKNLKLINTTYDDHISRKERYSTIGSTTIRLF